MELKKELEEFLSEYESAQFALSNLDDENKKREKKSVKDIFVIKFNKILDNASPKELDATLRRLAGKGQDSSHYPEELDNILYQCKNHKTLLRAAEYSLDLRIKETAFEEWNAPKQGSFVTIVLPNLENPVDSKIAFITERSADVMAGNGLPGGYLEAEELNANPPEYRPFREMAEELAEITPYDQSVITEILKPLKPYFQPLASYRDPSLYLKIASNKSWTATSHAHTLFPPPERDENAATAFKKLTAILQEAVDSQKGGEETKGANFIRIADLADVLNEFTYPHEALGTLISAQINLPGYIETINPEILDKLAEKMHVQTEDLIGHIKTVSERAQKSILPKPGYSGPAAFTYKQYKAAFEARHPSGKAVSGAVEKYSRSPELS